MGHYPLIWMNTPPKIFFTGVFEHSIDSVNRLVIPAKWRSGESEEFFLFGKDGGEIAVLTRSEVEKTLKLIEEAPDMSPRDKTREQTRIFSEAVQLTCDKQGRITMDAKLMKHAKLSSAVVLVGGGPRFEMWNPKAWEARKAEMDGTRSSALDRFGI
jgi:MraZ protein